MDSNKKNLREKLNEPPVHLPKELDWENMKDGVFEKMNNTQNINKVSRNNRFLYIITSIIIILTIPFCYNQYSGTKGDQNISNNNPFLIPEINPLQKAEILEEKSIYKSTDIQKGQNRMSNDLLSQSSDISSRTKTSRITENKIGSSSTTQSAYKSNYSEYNPNSKIAALEKDELGDTSADYSDLVEDLALSFLQVSDEEIDHIPSLPYSFQYLSKKEQLDLSIPSLSKVSSNGFHQIAFSTGVSFWDHGYVAGLPERAPFETNHISLSSHIDYRYHFQNNLFIKSGLDLHVLESLFDWSTTITDYTVTLKNVVIEKRTNALTGEVGRTFGDVEVEVEAERRVRHFNQITLLQVPVGIGKNHSFKSFVISYCAGASVNIMGMINGRTLLQEEVIDLESSGDDPFNADWAINGFVGAQLSYAVNKNWQLGLGLNYQRAFSNWSLEDNIDMRPQILNASLNVSYLFH